MTKDTAIIDLPPTPPAYVESYEIISTSHCGHRLDANDCGKLPPEEPPHDHEHGGEEPTPLRINVSDTLKLSENLAVEVKRGGR
jgi:hypothetical protein